MFSSCFLVVNLITELLRRRGLEGAFASGGIGTVDDFLSTFSLDLRIAPRRERDLRCGILTIKPLGRG